MDHALQQQAEAVIARGSKSFAAAARLFDPETRRDVMLLYAWCRHCDDLTDGQQLGRGRLETASAEALQQLRDESLAALGDAPSGAFPYRALAEVARRHPIGPALVEAHIHGFELDVAGWQPKTLEDTLQYSYHVAGSVGIMMALIMGVRDKHTLHRACDLGIAFQLTNIARDVAEDARAGRSYLPGEWLREAGLEVSDLADEAGREKAFPLVCRLVDTAEPYYASARIGERALPARAAWAIATARGVYRDIGLQIRKRGRQRLGERSHTSKSRKAWRAATGGLQMLGGRFRRTADMPPRQGLWTPDSLA
ncbi:MAG: phytoene/squalene synthase family protein [Wenzhouxiangellaceae bacterium]|nr:phytoene/squalene synthase family protein [Wenzhouxiangellaceae bacterium]MBS3824132.1 phytoene/squalene synthase family protein [Wenzhouxiangellaceae bacterium]